jgi:dienelactone hydrolase
VAEPVRRGPGESYSDVITRLAGIESVWSVTLIPLRRSFDVDQCAGRQRVYSRQFEEAARTSSGDEGERSRRKRLARSEEALMKHKLLISVAAVAVAAGAIIFPAVSAAQTPKMGGGYKDVIAIPVDGPNVKAIAGALFKPEGVGPFPAVVYMTGCAGLDSGPDRALQKSVVEHLRSKGFATLVVDPFTPRGETQGICDKWNDKWNAETFFQYGSRGAKDMWGAFNLLQARPDIDAKHIFVEGFDYGGISALFATATPAVTSLEAKPVGVVAYYPYCGFSVFGVPTLVLIGENDGVSSLELCRAKSGKPNLDMVILPNATHWFASPGMDTAISGTHVVYDPKAAEDAQARADAFMAAHMTEVKTQ